MSTSSEKRLRRIGSLTLNVILLWASCLMSAVSGLSPTEAFALIVNPTSLSFTGVQGGANPAPKSVAFYKKNKREKSWTATTSAAWITVTPTAGSLTTETDTVQVSVSTAGLAAGSYSGKVIIAVVQPDGRIANNNVSVALTVTQPSPTGFNVSPSSLAYTGTVGGPNQTLSVTITNTGTSTLTVTWHDSISWLIATSGDTVTMAPGGSATIAHTASTSGLAAGTYSGTATITGGGITKQVPITMTVSSTSTSPTIGVSPTSLSFSGTAGGANPAAKTVSISNTGGGTLTWTSSDNATWLSLSPAAGTNSGSITATVTLSGLAAGTYNAAITVAATGATNSPKTIPVTLTVNPPSTASSATLTWNANTDSDLAGYKVYRATVSGAYGAPIATLQGNTTSYVVSGLQAGTTYYFVVTAYDTAGNESAYSNEVSKSIY